ncbi:hypothetical protein AALO_G00128560 [Alosa alosa]|uniref:Nuclear receptor 2C2-associated protein n=1 Tax=Alosa alosa TaxID=278164 RepID=A0AAV6GRA0_9TELE|nr:hypothetical protein AALO_G00128560 [Alosa alosa]
MLNPKMAVSLICNNTQSRVSSVLNRDVKQFGKKYMFDSNEETCWNSDQCAGDRGKSTVSGWIFREDVQITRLPTGERLCSDHRLLSRG